MSEICARQHRDELAAADVVEDLQGPIWSQLRQVQVGCQFPEKVAAGFEKPHAREAVPLEIARQKAVSLKGQVPSQLWCGEMLHNQATWFITILHFCLWSSSCSSTHSSGAKYGSPPTPNPAS